MTQTKATANDFLEHVSRLRAVPDLFEPGKPILVARAPGGST